MVRSAVTASYFWVMVWVSEFQSGAWPPAACSAGSMMSTFTVLSLASTAGSCSVMAVFVVWARLMAVERVREIMAMNLLFACVLI